MPETLAAGVSAEHFTMKRLPILVVTGLALLTTAGLGQSKGDNHAGSAGDGGDQVEKNDPTKSVRVVYEKRGSGMVEITYSFDGRMQERVIPARELAELWKYGTIGTQRTSDIQAVVSARPHVLAPGQAGEVLVVVTVSGEAVGLPGKQADLSLDASGTPLQCGAPRLDPAPTGKRPGRFLGRPVYEDTMVFHVPVQVAADATAPQKAAIKGMLTLALYENDSGRVRGTFFQHIRGDVEIKGAPVPAAPKTAAESGGVATKRETPRDRESANVRNRDGEKPPVVGAGSLGSAAATRTPPDPEAAEPVQVTSDLRFGWVLGGIGIVVLGLIFVLLSRRR